MPYTLDAFQEEMAAIQTALDNDDFENLNVFCNRIMSNAALLKGSEFALAGFVLKDFNMILLSLKGSLKPRPLASAKSCLQLLVKKISTSAASGIKNSDVWDAYFTSFKILRQNILDENEAKAYSEERLGLSHEAFIALIEFIDSKKDVLSKTNNLIGTLVLETNRIYSTYGMDRKDTQIRALLVALNNIDSYVIQDAVTGTHILQGVSPIVSEYAAKVIAAAKKLDSNSHDDFTDNLMTEMITKWRELYLMYNDPNQFLQSPRPTQRKGSRIKIPEETQEKLAGLVTKNLEQEIKRAK